MKPFGLFICKSHCFLPASPDSLVCNADCTEPNLNGLAERKVVFLKENETLYEALIRKGIFLPGATDGHLIINRKADITIKCSNSCLLQRKLDLSIKGVQELPGRSIVQTEGVFILTKPLILDSGTQCFPNLRHFTMSTFL